MGEMSWLHLDSCFISIHAPCSTALKKEVSFKLDYRGHQLQMSLILLTNDKYGSCNDGGWKMTWNVCRVDSVWGVIWHWWCSVEHESLRDENTFLYCSLLQGGCGRLPLGFAEVHPSTDRSAFLYRIFSCIDSQLCLLYSQLALCTVSLTKSAHAKWIKSSTMVASIMPVWFLPFRFAPSLCPTFCLCLFSQRSCGQWPSYDRQIITLRFACQENRSEGQRRRRRRPKAGRRIGRQRHQVIINNPKWIQSLGEAHYVWLLRLPSPTPHCFLHFPVCR